VFVFVQHYCLFVFSVCVWWHGHSSSASAEQRSCPSQYEHRPELNTLLQPQQRLHLRPLVRTLGCLQEQARDSLRSGMRQGS
jgi:hypothetical protein